MKVHVGVWDSKYGTDAQVGESEAVVRRYFAKKCCDLYWEYVHPQLDVATVIEACAEFVFPKEGPSPIREAHILDAWKKYCDIESMFQFFEREVITCPST